jgi:hypothetical protein
MPRRNKSTGSNSFTFQPKQKLKNVHLRKEEKKEGRSKEGRKDGREK